LPSPDSKAQAGGEVQFVRRETQHLLIVFIEQVLDSSKRGHNSIEPIRPRKIHPRVSVVKNRPPQRIEPRKRHRVSVSPLPNKQALKRDVESRSNPACSQRTRMARPPQKRKPLFTGRARARTQQLRIQKRVSSGELQLSGRSHYC